MKQITFDGTWESFKPLFPINNAVETTELDKESKKLIFHLKEGTFAANIGDVVTQDEDGNILSININPV